MVKVSILIPAHNEEKVIGKALDRLADLRKTVKDFEVLVGLDGCTDSTEKIVRFFKFPKVFMLNERKGKHVVINFLLKKAKGEICIVHDADVQFNCKKEDFERMLEVFKDKRIGALADNYTVSYGIRSKKGLSMLYLGDLWNMYFLLKYKTMLFATPYKKSLMQVPREGDAKYFFYVNIFRKNSVKPQETLCDDGERLFDALANGKKAVLLPLMQKPFMITSIEKVSLKDLYRQKYRGAIARQQIAEKYSAPKTGISTISYLFFVLKSIREVKSIKAIAGIFLWLAVTSFAIFYFTVFGPKQKLSTKEGWAFRIER